MRHKLRRMKLAIKNKIIMIEINKELKMEILVREKMVIMLMKINLVRLVYMASYHL